jgi:perosamine synthetase
MRLYLDAPNVGDPEKAYLNRAIETGFLSTVGPLVSQFEERFRRHIDVAGAVTTQSGTAAIHLALYELGIGPGDEVIVPALTFIATANPVVYVGATPVLADVDPKTFNISAEEIERKITEKTKAIIPVHLYGNPCEMDKIISMAKRRGLYVIEDATESLGARYGKRHMGTFGDLGCFSFNGNKIITTGGGGMIVGNDAKRLEHVKFLSNQAKNLTESLGHTHPEIGFNYRMTNIEAALGLAQMDSLNLFLKKKKRFNTIYREGLTGINGLRFQESLEGAESAFWFTCVLFDRDIEVAPLIRKLKDKGVPTRRIFPPLTESSPYKNLKRGAYKNSYDIYRRGLCLPSSTLNREEDIYRACGILKETVQLEDNIIHKR